MSHMHSDQTGFSNEKRDLKRRVRDYLDEMRARRLRGKVLDPVSYQGQSVPITFPYRAPGPYALGYHTGEDHATPVGSRCQAVSYGHVVSASWGPWGEAYGYQIVIRTKGGKYDYAYCHLSRFNVKVGDQVVPGFHVGDSGDTGNTTGPHLHFEARPAGGHYGSDVNPINVKQKK